MTPQTDQLPQEWEDQIGKESLLAPKNRTYAYRLGWSDGYDIGAATYALRAYKAEQEAATLRHALTLFVDNVDRWLETDIPATAEESRLIYQTAKQALQGEKEEAGE